MHIHILNTTAELENYDRWVRAHPQGNLWQSLAWKIYQERLGREVRIYAADSACLPDRQGKQVESSISFDVTALVVIDRTIGGLSTWEIPRGPLFANSDEQIADNLLKTIIANATREKCICIYLSPLHHLPATRYSLRISSRHIQPQATRIIDLTKTDDEILAQMHPKGRYNIKVAERHGITIREGTAADIDAFYALLKSTSSRDVFHISQKAHYMHFLKDLASSYFLLAIHDGRPIAGLLNVNWGNTGYYYYGASDHSKRRLMAPYLLQWHAMKKCKAAGCLRYDLLGISAEKAPPNDPWWGITDFKRKFGGSVVTYPHEQMLVLRPMVKRGLEWKRKMLG